ncbi:hypothetical protein [Demequina globuliformis]|uniref:hypothetical protein n=1 Tax=Demequina globuliformis TaxID=676202 RepID=UPI000780E2ED|nr:hypothetical protein [Demequina globuliformis]
MDQSQTVNDGVVPARAPVVADDLMRHAADRDPLVRASAAASIDCPVAPLTALAYDPSADVLHALVKNPRTPSSVIRRLADHRNAAVAEAATQRLRTSFRS